MASETLLAGWQSYDRGVIPADAPPVQHEECRRSFYAGAWLMFNLMMAATASTDDDCEDRLAALQAEAGGIVKDLRIT
jgi:hypothetical protein